MSPQWRQARTWTADRADIDFFNRLLISANFAFTEF